MSWVRIACTGKRGMLPEGSREFSCLLFVFADWMKPLKPLIVAH